MKTKKLGQEPAFPAEVTFVGEQAQECIQTGNTSAMFPGMSKRLYLAGMAMQGILAHTGYEQNEVSAISSAFRFADELLKQEAE